MKGIIIYKGKYGATRQYAEWLSDELSIPAFEADDLDRNILNNYDFVILASSVYIGKLQLRKWIARHQDQLKDKRLFLLQIAGSPPDDEKKRMEYNRASLPGSILSCCKYFFLPGRLTIEKLSWWDRFMLKMGARLTKNPADKMIMLTNYDHVHREHLRKIVAEAKKLQDSIATGNTMITLPG